MAAIALFVTACATTSGVSLKPVTTVRDAPEEGRLYISIRNGYDTPICLYPTNWPDGEGIIGQAADRAWLEVEGQRFPMVELEAGYCPGCRTMVLPTESVVAFVNYSDFRLPTALHSRPKRLVFQPEAQRCRRM